MSKKYKFQYMIFKNVRALTLLMPEKARFKFAETLGILGYHVIKKRQHVTLANLKMAFPEKSYEERKEIAKKSYKIMAKAFFSTLWAKEYLRDNVKMVGIERLLELKEEGNGVAVGLIHMGNMEASSKVGEHFKFVTIAKKQRNPYIDEFITNSRKELNVILLKKSAQTPRELNKYCKEKNIIGLFTDHRDNGADVVFFGKETKSPTGVVREAIKHNMPLIIGYNIMNDDNTSTTYFTDKIELINTGNFKDDVRANTQLLMDEIEKIIRKYPEQWMWFHDRWKLSKVLNKKDIKK